MDTVSDGSAEGLGIRRVDFIPLSYAHGITRRGLRSGGGTTRSSVGLLIRVFECILRVNSETRVEYETGGAFPKILADK